MSINVTITAATPEELTQYLQGLGVMIRGTAPVSAPAPSIITTVPEPSTQTNKVEKPQATVQEAIPAAEPQAQTIAEDAPPQQPTPETTPSVSLEEVRACLAALVRAGKQTSVKALFPKFSASKLSEVPENRLGELLAAAKEIA